MEKIIHNIQTGKIEVVELNADELKEFEQRKIKAEQMAAGNLAAQQAAAEAKEALLEKLGITEEEVKLLLS